MKKIRILLSSLLVTVSITALTSIGASANEWKQSNGNWWYDKGNSYSVGWEQINGAWYFFGQDGYMKIGWIQDAGNWYYLNSNGTMATNTTIDGYYVGSDGGYTTANAFQNKHASLGKAGTNGASAQSMAEQNGYQDDTQSNTSSDSSIPHATGAQRKPAGAKGNISGQKIEGGAQDKDLGDALNNGHK